MKIAVFGVGSIGGWFAAALSRAGAQPTLVARGATLDNLQREGLRITQSGTTQQLSVRSARAHDLGPQDLVLLTIKAQQFSAALEELQPLLGPQTCIVTVMNGIPWWFFRGWPGPLQDVVLQAVDPQQRAAQLLAGQAVVGCVVHASVRSSRAAEVSVGSVDRLIFGTPDGKPSAPLHWLTNTFPRAGIPAHVSERIRDDIWLKLWGNMNMNPLSALTRSSTAPLLADSDIRELCRRMMQEMVAASVRLGLHLPHDPDERIAITRRLGDFKPSMLQDVEAGRPLEYAAQLGAVVEIAQRVGVAAPFCAAILALTRLLSASVSSPTLSPPAP